jgi:hypothetical protein
LKLLGTKSKAAAEYMSLIANADEKHSLSNLMVTRKKTFFINVYNGFTNISLRKNPAQYKDRGTFFSQATLYHCRKKLSLDIIEHGFKTILIKWNLGAA